MRAVDACALGGWAGLARPHATSPHRRLLSRGARALADDGLGVVIVDHGSRRAESNAMLHEFAALYRRTTGRALVEVAHMELAEPTLAQAVGACAAAGARRVVVAPYFLSQGRHVQADIPALAAGAAAQHPGVEVVVAEPIGVDPLMARIIEDRVLAAAAAAAAAAAGGRDGPPAAAAALDARQ